MTPAVEATVERTTRGAVTIPREAFELPGFRRWHAALGEEAPRVHFLQGDLHVDMTPQNLRTHLPVTTAINAVLALLARDHDLGEYFADGAWLTHEAVGLSTVPDGLFVRWATFSSGLARVSAEREDELEGRPDMVLEVVSRSSATKDEAVLPALYAAAGIPEYWLVDARGDGEPALRLLVLEAGAYRDAPHDADGWVRSPVWGRRFRLRATPNPRGGRTFSLEHGAAAG